ncbi:YccS family putative transporter [Xenophilus arseniciresistens]|uniref:YccS family putative transporter n=1 Tax=Xenophilus arseniciresistens TaxID=1283306 RepID=A0AAE3SXA7_9BURK|nr:YccS family putative transporter [Xenophilus arseniciresistens]MDA7414739.1 YccS family putative transporter [Xenophilus arseniciresistens]
MTIPGLRVFLKKHGLALGAQAQALRVLLVLGGLTAVCRWYGWSGAALPLALGVIASALAETDDSWRGRLRAQLATLACFALMACGVEWLFPHPWAYVCGFALAAFGLTMLGAVGARYKAIVYATLILGMYATLGAEHAQAVGLAGWRWQEPALLLAGAAAFGLVSVLWCALFPALPVQARLVRLFQVLGAYVQYKASLFEPLRDVAVQGRRLVLAQRNAAVVDALNATKEALFSRLGRRPHSGRLARYRGLYLIAQDVHERASSSHEQYEALAHVFFHSDLLYRCQRVLHLQGIACQRLADSIARREPFVMGDDGVQALAELRSAIAHARAQQPTPEAVALLASVQALARNLAQLQAQLAGASHTAHPAARLGRADMSLFDRSPRTWHDAWARVRSQCNTRSPLFRHGVRLGVALAAGFGVMTLFHLPQGYWIMLTTLFVCQPSYGDTIARMGQRIAGTALGVVLGWALIELFPQPLLQTLFAVLAGVLFFAMRSTRYLLATACMTLLVLMSFHQVMDSAALIVPRLIDTAIGSVIAGLAVLLVLPHWQARRIHEVAGRALREHAAYLQQIAAQYRSGASDTLAYRLARRNAHNADAALATAVNEMLREPGFARPQAGAALRFLIQAHTLLNYLSALGSHRTALGDAARGPLLQQAADEAGAALLALGEALARGQPPPADTAAARAARAALSALSATGAGDDAWLEGEAAVWRLVRTQLELVWLQVDALRQHAREWLGPAKGPSAQTEPEAQTQP